mmetsp:Transcript_525/g.844  ORF Transcript_525/g.844 Transcript_525/m.844 type:complete len:209 (+) Transcript_525:1-627(+)
MDHIYDWTFWDIIGSTHRDASISKLEKNTSMTKPQRIVVSASMLKEQEQKQEQQSAEDEDINGATTTPSTTTKTKRVKYFNAFFDIHRTPFTPFHLCYQLIKFPIYCMIIQVWIHIEAFRLFAKGVEFIPHPEGSETGVSVLIGHMMAPFFAVKEWWEQRGHSRGRGQGGSDGGTGSDSGSEGVSGTAGVDKNSNLNLDSNQEKTKNE